MPSHNKVQKSASKGMIRKLLIVHKRALEDKYQKSGYLKIEAALQALVKADAAIGLTTKIVLVDAKVPAGGVSAITPSNAGKFKNAVDAIYKDERKPDYLVLVGGPDVIPHIPLRSPWGSRRAAGEDEFVDSDLPYASDHRHTLDPSKFGNAIRMVGRIPDVPGASSAIYLVDRINEAASAPALSEKQIFSLSAEVWKGASKEIVNRVFGRHGKLYCCPKLGPTWTTQVLKKDFQFINCHGDTRKAVFYGEQAARGGGPLPHAINTTTLVNKVVPGAVVVTECCYGAELFEPRLPHQPQGMAYTYLEQGATTFLGSSTISYGGAEAVDLACADELCLFFLEGILRGDSCGEALADARRRLVEGQTLIDNYQVKTLAQFMLLGDPSRRPINTVVGVTVKKTANEIGAKSVSDTRPHDQVRSAPLTKATPSPVANQALVGDLSERLPFIPIPKSAIYDATLYAAGEGASMAASRVRISKASTSGNLQGATADATPQLGILEVSIPNDPAFIAFMRNAWDQASKGSQPTIGRVRKAAMRERLSVVDAEGVSWVASPHPPFSFSDELGIASYPQEVELPPLSQWVGLASDAAEPPDQPPPNRGEAGSAQFLVEPERNRRAYLVARIANGQIQSYKVVVAR